jgi:cupin fold WbuC family metalloprotein
MNQDNARVTWIDRTLLDDLSEAASASPRRRKNHNFHPADDFVAHRLLNAILPDSYIPPHCHADASKDETILVLRGRLGVVIFAPDGRVLERAVLSVDGPRVGIDIPHGVFHTLVALDDECLMFEAKAGPFRPLTDAEKARWAPAEGDSAAAAYLDGLRRDFD